MRLALIQPLVTADKAANCARARDTIARCALRGADMVVLPEMFCCPSDTALFPLYAEPAGGEIWRAMSSAAAENRVWLVAGSFPERGEDGGIYNTSFVFAPDGTQRARHRKVHLFDVEIDGGQHFCESETLSAGSSATTFETPFGVFGLCICYDFRFPELARMAVNAGAECIIVPAVFNMSTGPLHWELTWRARAVDNQVFTVGCAPARDEGAEYVSYGNSIVCSPWGEVLGRLGADEGVLFADIDLADVYAVRRQLPLLKHRRADVYGGSADS